MTRLNAEIIGLGNWGRVQVNAVQGRSERIRFAAGATGTPARAEAFAARQGIALLPDLEAVLARPDVAGRPGLSRTKRRSTGARCSRRSVAGAERPGEVVAL